MARRKSPNPNLTEEFRSSDGVSTVPDPTAPAGGGAGYPGANRPQDGRPSLDSKNSGLELGKGAPGHFGGNPADKHDGEGMNTLDDKNSGLRSGSGPSTSPGSLSEPRKKLDAKNPWLETKVGAVNEVIDILKDYSKEDIMRLAQALREQDDEDKEDKEDDEDKDEDEDEDKEDEDKGDKDEVKVNEDALEEEDNAAKKKDAKQSTDYDWQSDERLKGGKAPQSEEINLRSKIKRDDLNLDTDIQALFDGGSFSEDFRVKAQDMYETAVLTAVNKNLKKMAEDAKKEILRSREAIKENMVVQVDSYMNYCVKEFMKENALAIEQGLRTEIAEDLLHSLKTLFESHYVSVPDGKEDLVDQLAVKVENLETALNREMTKNIELSEEIEKVRRAEIVQDIATGLTEVQKAKLRELSENVEYVNDEDYGQKISDLRATFVAKPRSRYNGNDRLIREQAEGETSADPFINVATNYMSRMSRIGKAS